MGEKKITAKEIAENLGVSRATVSRALNGSSGVGPELRKKILSYAQESGYKTVPTTADLSRKSTKIIGLVFGDICNPFYSELTFYIQRILNSHGYMVVTFNSEYNASKELEFIEMAEQFSLCGLILFTTQMNMNPIRLQAENIPIVFVNRSLELSNYDSVTLDNFKAGYISAMHLIELGHQRIGFVTGHALSSASVQRMEGFCQAMKNFYLPVKPSDILQGDLKMSTGYQLAHKFFQKKSRPSALILGNDMMALGFLDWCKEHNVLIPDELSIVSFDDIVFSQMHEVGLTTISQHVKEMGEHAARLIIRRIHHPDSEYKRIILEPSLIIRATTSHPKDETLS